MTALSRHQSVLIIAALLSLIAGFIHVLVVPEHFGEWWGYGSFFLATVIAQTLYAPALLRRPSRDLLLAGALGNAAIVAMWFVSRFVGIPFFGPGAGQLEQIGTLDVVCTSVEIVLVAMLVAELWFTLQETQRHPVRANQITLKHTTA